MIARHVKANNQLIKETTNPSLTKASPLVHISTVYQEDLDDKKPPKQKKTTGKIVEDSDEDDDFQS